MSDRSRIISRKIASNCLQIVIDRLEEMQDNEVVEMVRKIKRHLDKKWFGDPFTSL